MAFKPMWRVRYYYLASGMDGKAEERDYGVTWAWTAEEAIENVARYDQMSEGYDDATKEWFKSCLIAEKL